MEIASRHICILPDDALLTIFSFLTASQKCIAARVCRRWRDVIAQDSVWKHVDATDTSLSLDRLRRLIMTRCSRSLVSLKIRGLLSTDRSTWKRPSLSDAVLQQLARRCPRLSRLELHAMNLCSGLRGLNSLPSCLRTLAIVDCSLPTGGWFRCDGTGSSSLLGRAAVAVGGRPSHRAPPSMPRLVRISLAGTSSVTDSDLADLAAATGGRLSVLCLDGCYRLTSAALDSLPDLFPRLVSLGLRQVQHVSEPCLRSLAARCSRLRRVHLSDNGCLAVRGMLERLRQTEPSVDFRLDECDQSS